MGARFWRTRLPSHFLASPKTSACRIFFPRFCNHGPTHAETGPAPHGAGPLRGFWQRDFFPSGTVALLARERTKTILLFLRPTACRTRRQAPPPNGFSMSHGKQRESRSAVGCSEEKGDGQSRGVDEGLNVLRLGSQDAPNRLSLASNAPRNRTFLLGLSSEPFVSLRRFLPRFTPFCKRNQFFTGERLRYLNGSRRKTARSKTDKKHYEDSLRAAEDPSQNGERRLGSILELRTASFYNRGG